MLPEEDEKLKMIQVTAQKLYPGRTFDQLSPEEQSAVFANHEALAAQGAANSAVGPAKGKNVGADGRIYVAPNAWEIAANAVQQGIGGWQTGLARKGEATGRRAAADLITNRDAKDQAVRDTKTAAERKREEDFMRSLMGGR